MDKKAKKCLDPSWRVDPTTKKTYCRKCGETFTLEYLTELSTKLFQLFEAMKAKSKP